MALAVLTQLPASVTAGSTVTYTSAQSDYTPSDGWGLTLYLAGASVATVAASVVDGQFTLTLSAATTAALTPGLYQFSETVSKGTGPTLEKHEVGRGTVRVLADITAATAGSVQTFAEKMLASVEAKLAERLAADVESYTVGGRSVQKTRLEELQKQRAYWYRQVVSERNRKAGKYGRTIYYTPGGINP